MDLIPSPIDLEPKKILIYFNIYLLKYIKIFLGSKSIWLKAEAKDVISKTKK